MLLVMKGYSSSYQIWNHITENPDLDPNIRVKPMAYNNVNKRMTNLYKKGYLKEAKHLNDNNNNYSNRVNIHGRKDYQVTSKGIEHVIPYVFTQPEEIQNVVQYMKIVSSSMSSMDMNMNWIEHLQKSIIELHKGLMNVKEILTIQHYKSQKQIVESKSKSGRLIKTTSYKIPENLRSEYDEQIQQQIESGIPEIDSSELEVNISRMQKPERLTSVKSQQRSQKRKH